MTDSRDVSRHFADLVVDTTYEGLGPAAAEAAKKSVLDTVGVALAASGMEPASRAALDVIGEAGGRAEATALGCKRRVPAMMAAFANGALAHGLDFDDQTPWGQHASSSVVPAVLAVAERRGGISGSELVTAVAVGQDIFARLRCHVGWRKDWNLSSVFGVLAAAAAASRVIGLSRAAAHHALGIASQQSCGIMEAVAGTGSDLRGMYAGFSAKGAVLAALLAERGLTGVENLFEGQYGIFNTYFRGEYDRAAMLRDLGVDHRGAGTLYKLWPAVGTAHNHIHATVRIVTENDVAVDDIDEIRIHVGDYHRLMSTPLEDRQNPSTLVDAKFSLPFLVAIAAVRRGMGVADFTGGRPRRSPGASRRPARRRGGRQPPRLDAGDPARGRGGRPARRPPVRARERRRARGAAEPGDMGTTRREVRRLRCSGVVAAVPRAGRGGGGAGTQPGVPRRRDTAPARARMSASAAPRVPGRRYGTQA